MKLSINKKSFFEIWIFSLVLVLASYVREAEQNGELPSWLSGVHGIGHIIVYALFTGVIIYELIYFCLKWKRHSDKVSRIAIAMRLIVVSLVCIGCMLIEHFWNS